MEPEKRQFAEGSRWAPVAVLWGCFFFAYMARQSLYSTFPLLREELHFSEAQLGMTTTVFAWLYALGNGLGGKLADVWSRKRLIVWSLVLWSAAVALTGLAQSPEALLAGRGGMAVAQALYTPAALALIGAIHAAATRSTAITLHGTGQFVGVIAGGWYGGAAAEWAGWRWMLWLLAGTTMLYVPFVLGGLREPARPATAAADAARPVGLAALLGIRTYAVICLCSLAVNAMLWMLYTWLPDLLRERFHLSLATAGLVATSYVQVSMIAGLLLGAVAGDRWQVRNRRGRLYLMIAGLGLACPCFVAISAAPDLAGVKWAAIGYGFSKGWFTSNYVACLMDVVPQHVRGFAVGAMTMLSGIGGAGAPYLLGRLKSQYAVTDIFAAAAALGWLATGLLIIAAWRWFLDEYERQSTKC